MIQSTLPPRAGLGFKPQHFDAIVAQRQPVGFFEIHAENYMGDGGLAHAHLRKLREDYGLSVHGVGLSIGSRGPLDRDHLTRLKTLCDRYEPESFSEHLAWSSHEGMFLNDLLPLPYTEETLRSVIGHVEQVQDTLKRQMLLENPATYLRFAESTIAEVDFLAEIARRTGCGLLLDINNVFVSASNHSEDPYDYLSRFPVHAVREIHLAGHSETESETGAVLLIDTHDKPVRDRVWQLFESLIARTGPIASLVEQDNNVPEWPVLLDEAKAAEDILNRQARLQVA